MAASRSYGERHEDAKESFRRFAPGVEPERVAESFARRQGALGSMAFDVVGAMWSRPQLKRRDRSLLVISALCAQARDEELVVHTRIGIQNGLKPAEIEEILLHIAAYAGFPAAMAASRKVDQGLREALKLETLPDRNAADEKSDAQRDRDAAVVLRSIAGSASSIEPEAGLARMEAMFGELGATIYRWAFGEIWSREQLSRRDRSIVVLTILVALGAVAELEVHVPAGLRHGLTRVEIEEIVHHLALYAGIPRAVEAARVVKSALEKSEPST